MSSFDFSEFVGLASKFCPLRGAAAAAEGKFASILSSAGVYISPGLYARFALSLLVYPLAFEVLVFFLFGQSGLPLMAPFVLIQSLPFVFPAVRTMSRRRFVEAELPFFLISMSVFSHESYPTIQDGLSRIAELGDGILPYLNREAALLQRNLTYLAGTPADVVEETFSSHPSRKMKEFVNGFLSTLSSSKSPMEFVLGEANRSVALLDVSWSAFTGSLASVAEISFMLLALFPVGLQMVAATLPGVGTAQLLMLSYLLLILTTLGLLAFVDSIQPALQDTQLGNTGSLATTGIFCATTLAYLLGVLNVRLALIVSLGVAAFFFRGNLAHLRKIRRGEEEISMFLHELAEESKSGRSLPECIDRLAPRTGRYSSIKDAFFTFSQTIKLGETPAAALKIVKHPSWMVRVSFGILALAFVTGAGFEQLERLSSFFKRVTDARRNAVRSLLPFVGMGVAVPAISMSALSFLSGLRDSGLSLLTGTTIQFPQTFLVMSILIASFLTGSLLSKLYSSSIRNVIALPLVLLSTLVCLFLFGIGG